jgi:hypothetical protein
MYLKAKYFQRAKELIYVNNQIKVKILKNTLLRWPRSISIW